MFAVFLFYEEWDAMINADLYKKIEAATLSISSLKNKQLLRDEMIYADELFSSDSDIWIGVHTAQMNSETAFLHGHDFFEIVYVLQGVAYQRVESHEIKLSKGTLCIMNPNIRHELYVDGDDSCALNIALKTSLFNATFLSLIGEHGQLGAFFLSYFLAKKKAMKIILSSRFRNQ